MLTIQTKNQLVCNLVQVSGSRKQEAILSDEICTAIIVIVVDYGCFSLIN